MTLKKSCTLAKTYVVLKSSKISKCKPISKQGKAIKVKASSSTVVAAKYAMAYYKNAHKKLSTLYLYRRGKIMRFTVKFKVVAGKTRVAAKKASTKTLKVSKKSPTNKKKRTTKKCTKKRTTKKCTKGCPKKWKTHKKRKTVKKRKTCRGSRPGSYRPRVAPVPSLAHSMALPSSSSMMYY